MTQQLCPTKMMCAWCGQGEFKGLCAPRPHKQQKKRKTAPERSGIKLQLYPHSKRGKPAPAGFPPLRVEENLHLQLYRRLERR